MHFSSRKTRRRDWKLLLQGQPHRRGRRSQGGPEGSCQGWRGKGFVSCEAAWSHLIQMTSLLKRYRKLRALLKTLPITCNFTALLIRTNKIYSYALFFFNRPPRKDLQMHGNWSHARYPTYRGALSWPLFYRITIFFCLKSSHLITPAPSHSNSKTHWLLICINWPEIYILYTLLALRIFGHRLEVDHHTQLRFMPLILWHMNVH